MPFLPGAHKLSFADCGGLFPARGAKGAGLPRRAISSAVGSEVHVADIAAAAAHGLSVAKRRLLGGWVERCEGLWLLVLIVEGGSFRQHTLMQDAVPVLRRGVHILPI